MLLHPLYTFTCSCVTRIKTRKQKELLVLSKGLFKPIFCIDGFANTLMNLLWTTVHSLFAHLLCNGVMVGACDVILHHYVTHAQSWLNIMVSDLTIPYIRGYRREIVSHGSNCTDLRCVIPYNLHVVN